MLSTKKQMYSALRSGILGNTGKIYNSLQDVPDGELVVLRYASVSSMGRCVYGIAKHDIKPDQLDNAVICEYPQAKANTVMNAEVMESEHGMYLRYKTGNMVMRKAMKSPTVATGLVALSILRTYMDDTSFDTLLELYNTYRDHVIELTVFDRAVGTHNLPTIFWEVRKY